jgi:hypothetical protein
MALTTVSELRTTLGVGTLYTDAVLQEVCDASDAVLLPMLWANNNFAVSHSNVGTVGTLVFDVPVSNVYYVGQTVSISNAGSRFNGNNKTILSVSEYAITVTTTHTSDNPNHPFNPPAVVTATTYVDWTTDTAVAQAALLISVDIWQSRQVSSTGGVSPDFTPSPYRMGNTLLARVRGLIAHALDPRSMVG